MPDNTTPTTPPKPAAAPPAPAAQPPPDPAAIAAKANHPDAVTAAIKAERDAAKAARAEAQAAADRAKAAEATVKQFEDRDKTDLEQAIGRAEAAEARAKQLEGQVLRSQIAAEKNLPAALAARLQGEGRKELEADADQLLKDVQPVGQFTPGVRGAGDGAGPADMNSLIRAAAGRGQAA